MCGIIGTIGNIPSKTEFEKARDLLSHRGPDDAGLHYDKDSEVALGHRRLSIIDLSKAGHQPMCSADKRYTIIFNGEIYNYLELKEQLKNKYTFTTHTDTEVLLAAYIVWGKDCLQKLNGMFSFAVWDNKEKELFAVRDRLGIKPFYYHVSSKGFIFASEIKGVLALNVKAKPNNKMIYDYLARGLYDHSKETFFNEIHKLPAGHFLTYKNGILKIEKYWDLADMCKTSINITQEEAVNKFIKLFSDSIKLRLRSDVEVGVNLSSGLDSASILFFAEHLSGKNLRTFSMGSSENEYDETLLISPTLSDKQKTKWSIDILRPEEIEMLIDKILKSQDEPYGGIPNIAYHKLAELEKKEGVVVILEGQGGDELLAGYVYYQTKYIKEAFTQAGYSQDMSKEVNTRVLNEKFITQHAYEPDFKKPFDSQLLNAQYHDIVYSKLPRILRFNDRLSMSASREYREPLLDHRLVEFLFFLPENIKIHEDVQKFLLREAMKNIVPHTTATRPKKTFGAMQIPWFRKHLKKYIMTVLLSESFAGRPYWNQDEVLKEAERFFSGEGDNSFFIWQWVNLELWLREYID